MTSAQDLAIVFPGQGCQFVGMGQTLVQQFPEARQAFERADDVLGFALSELCFAGPEAQLGDTANTQPAIFVTTMAMWGVLEPRFEGLRSRLNCVAGHSLGEFSALAVSGALGFEDGVRLVRSRGEAMREAGEVDPGGMAAIIGLSDEVVAEIVAEAGAESHDVWVANYNSPGQVVVAGSTQALTVAIDLAKQRGAKRAVPLAVSVACHTPFMKTAAESLGAALKDAQIHRPWLPVISNAEAQALDEPQALEEALLRQLYSPVRWVESIQHMVARGVTTTIEIGPKEIVSGLIKRIERSINRVAITETEQVMVFDGGAL